MTLRSGAGYILSKRAVIDLVEKSLPNDEGCKIPGGSGAEDVGMGKCIVSRSRQKVLGFYQFQNICSTVFKELLASRWLSRRSEATAFLPFQHPPTFRVGQRLEPLVFSFMVYYCRLVLWPHVLQLTSRKPRLLLGMVRAS